MLLFLYHHVLSSGCHLQVNGEIYNHEELKAKLKTHEFQTGSDCEVIAHLVSCISNSYTLCSVIAFANDFIILIEGSSSVIKLCILVTETF